MYRANKYLWALLAFALMSGGVVARDAVPTPTETLESVFIMQVDGWITIDPQGKVADYHRDTTVPDNLTGPIEKAVRSWLFKPVLIAGAPVQAKARMRITLAAQKSGDTFNVKIDNVTFPAVQGEQSQTADGKPLPFKVKSLSPPSYPYGLLRAGISGNVLLGLKIGLDGRVEDCVAIQTALMNVYGEPRKLAAAIRAMEQSAVGGTKKWRFTVDATDGAPSEELRSVEITIYYSVDTHPMAKPGKWHMESRTAMREMPWLPDDPDSPRVGVSDTNPGELSPVTNSIRLASDAIGKAL